MMRSPTSCSFKSYNREILQETAQFGKLPKDTWIST